MKKTSTYRGFRVNGIRVDEIRLHRDDDNIMFSDQNIMSYISLTLENADSSAVEV